MADEALRSRVAEPSWGRESREYQRQRERTSYDFAYRTRMAESGRTGRTNGHGVQRPTADRAVGRMRVVRKLLIGSVLAVLAVVAGELTFQHLVAPNLAIRTIELSGDAVISRDQLLEQTGLTGTVLYYHLDTAYIERQLSALPQVRSVGVEKVFPDTIHVTVEARSPLFVTYVHVDGQLVPAVADSAGVIFRIDVSGGEATLPVLSGIRFENFGLGDAMPTPLRPLFEDLQLLRRDYPGLYAMISEIRVSERNGRYETVLYPVHARVPVRLDARARPSTYEQVVRVLDILRAEGMLSQVAEIDLRTGEIVYTMRGEG